MCIQETNGIFLIITQRLGIIHTTAYFLLQLVVPEPIASCFYLGKYMNQKTKIKAIFVKIKLILESEMSSLKI